MTELHAEKTEGQPLPFGVAFDWVPGLDGRTWPRIQIINGLTAFTLTLPPEEFEKWVTGVWNEGHKVLEQVKKENNPIKVHTSLPPISPKANGFRS